MKESDIEARVGKLLAAQYGPAVIGYLKTDWINYPDRIVLFSDGSASFVEFKRGRGHGVTDGQAWKLANLRHAGFPVYLWEGELPFDYDYDMMVEKIVPQNIRRLP